MKKHVGTTAKLIVSLALTPALLQGQTPGIAAESQPSSGWMIRQGTRVIRQTRRRELESLMNSASRTREGGARASELQRISDIVLNKGDRYADIWPRVRQYLSDRDARVRLAAVLIATNLEDPSAEESLRSLAASDPDLRTRRAAIYALAMCARDKAIPELHDWLKDPNLHVRLEAAAALGELHDDTGYAVALEALQDHSGGIRRSPFYPPPDVHADSRVHALGALGHIGKPEARAAIQQEFQAGHLPSIPYQVAMMRIDLKTLPGESERLSYLRKALRDPLRTRRDTAVWMLTLMQNDPRAVALLAKAAADPTHPARASARNAVQSLGLNP